MFFADGFHPTARLLMLGITDIEEDGEWKTLDGEPVSFTNWNSGEPNGGASNHYAFVYTKIYEQENSLGSTGSWNDVSRFNNPDGRFICTYEPSMPGKI